MYISIIVSLVLVLSLFAMLAGKADEKMWVKSRINPARRRMQKRITRGKASLR